MVSVHVEALFVTVALKGRAGDEMLPRIAADGQGTIMTISEYGVQRVGGVVESLPACCMTGFDSQTEPVEAEGMVSVKFGLVVVQPTLGVIGRDDILIAPQF